MQGAKWWIEKKNKRITTVILCGTYVCIIGGERYVMVKTLGVNEVKHRKNKNVASTCVVDY